jgi:hypothetical protein
VAHCRIAHDGELWSANGVKFDKKAEEYSVPVLKALGLSEDATYVQASTFDGNLMVT